MRSKNHTPTRPQKSFLKTQFNKKFVYIVFKSKTYVFTRDDHERYNHGTRYHIDCENFL